MLNHTPTQAPTVSLRGPAQDLQNEREARVSQVRNKKFLYYHVRHSVPVLPFLTMVLYPLRLRITIFKINPYRLRLRN